MSCNQNTKACGSCPFSRQCEPGSLGGSGIAVYLGQINGPFHLPCHSAADYQGNDTPCSADHAQCAGAAIFRANIGRGKMMPDPLLKLDAGTDPNVFNTLEEFVQHHRPDLNKHEIFMLVGNWPEFMRQQLVIAAAKGGCKTKEQAQEDYEQ